MEITKPRLRRAEAATYLLDHHGINAKVKTLAKYATTGGGPRYQICGRFPLYPVAELDAWAEAKLSPVGSSSSEHQAQAA